MTVPPPDPLTPHAPYIRALARSLVADAATADDLAQEAFLRSLDTDSPNRSPGSFRAWISTILRNLAHSHHRDESRRARVHDQLRERARDAGQEDLDQHLVAHESLITAVRALAEPYREAILLRYFENLPPRAIAKRVGVPVRTVHTRLRRALELLRNRLGAKHGERRWLAMLAPLAAGAPSSTLLIMSTKTKVAAVASLCALAAVFAWNPLTVNSTEDAPPNAPPTAIAASGDLDEAGDPAANGTAAPTRDAVDAPAAAAPEDVPAFLSPYYLAGRVLDLEGRPVGDVPITFTPFGADENATLPTVDANPDGYFEFGLEHVQGGNLDVVHEEWSTVLRPVLWGQPKVDPLTIVVTRRAPIRGVVVDLAGTPQPDARVQLHVPMPDRASFPRSLERNVPAEWKVECDEDGRFAIPNAPSLDGASLYTRCNGFRDDRRPLSGSPPDADLRIELHPGAVLLGRVVDQVGRPVEGAAVILHGEIVKTDERGEFGLDLEKVTVDSWRSRHRWLVGAVPGRQPGRVQCVGDDWRDPRSWPNPLEIRMRGPTLTISGHVLRDDGGYYEGVQVEQLDGEHVGDATVQRLWGDEMATYEYYGRVDIELEEGIASFSESAIDSPGEFAIRGLQDRSYRLRVRDWQALREYVTESVHAGTTDLELRFPPESHWPTIRGTVVDRRGNAVAEAGIWFRRTTVSDQLESERIQTDSAGKFEYEGLARGATTLLVQGPGIAHPTPFEIPTLGDLEDVRVVIPVRTSAQVVATATSRTGSRVVFHDARGEPIAVTITHGNMAWGQHHVDLKDGQSEAFTLPDDAIEALLLDGETEITRMRLDLAPDRTLAVRF